MPANNLHIKPELLAELEHFCRLTQGAARPWDRYDATKAANEAIAHWLQTEGVVIMMRVSRSPEEQVELTARARRQQMELVTAE
jgi:hypothetical protein